MLVVEASLYVGKRGVPGDFDWMHKQPQFQDALFISLENFVDMLTANVPGGGSACLRDKAFYDSLNEADGNKKCSVGIPTGWSKESAGFTVLDTRTRKVIDNAFDRLCRVLQFFPNRFKRVIYPCDETDPTLIGTRIFKSSLAETVIEYISTRLQTLPQYVRLFAGTSLRVIYRSDLDSLPHALQLQKLHILEWQLSESRKSKRIMPPGVAPVASRQRTLIGNYALGK